MPGVGLADEVLDADLPPEPAARKSSSRSVTETRTHSTPVTGAAGFIPLHGVRRVQQHSGPRSGAPPADLDAAVRPCAQGLVERGLPDAGSVSPCAAVGVAAPTATAASRRGAGGCWPPPTATCPATSPGSRRRTRTRAASSPACPWLSFRHRREPAEALVAACPCQASWEKMPAMSRRGFAWPTICARTARRTRRAR